MRFKPWENTKLRVHFALQNRALKKPLQRTEENEKNSSTNTDFHNHKTSPADLFFLYLKGSKVTFSSQVNDK